ncbi:MAG: M14 family zinc carboxypeptidase [bacterium]
MKYVKEKMLNTLLESYEKYSEKKLFNKRFTHAEIKDAINCLKLNRLFTVELLGKSIEQREINLVKFGDGKIKVLLWSQMHGDEPTATMSFFDIFNFFTKDDNFNEIRNYLLQNITFYFVPLLNPDGCEKMDRRNAAGIDINRDFLRLQSPESVILKELASKTEPDFAFNMHDQDYRWSVGDTANLATISFLAPVCDKEKSISEIRKNAIKLISALNKDLAFVVEGRTARYPDDYEPRSFGDNFSKDYSTILIECGRNPGDINKNFTRRLNYAALLNAFMLIADESYTNASIDEYFAIPTNGNFLYDLILRNVTYKTADTSVQIDVCINREETYYAKERIPYLKSNIEDIGDCSNVKGIEEINCTGLTIKTKGLLKEICDTERLTEIEIGELLSQGLLFVKTKNNSTKPYVNVPINYCSEYNQKYDIFDLGCPANFVLTKNDVVKYLVFNGECKSINNTNEIVVNGLHFI